MHAAESWYPGPTRETYRGVARNSCKRQCKVIDQTSAFGIRVALPTWRTMPIAALRRETGIPPAQILLEERRLKTAARIRTLDEYHPLRLRATESTDSARHRLGLKTCNKTRLGFDRVHDSRVQRMYRLLPEAEPPPPLRSPAPPQPIPRWTSKKEAARFIREWLPTLPPDYLCVYSDGSGASTDKVSWAFVTFIGDTGTLIEQSGSGKITNAEVHGAFAALEAIITRKRNRGRSAIYIPLDNSAANQVLLTGTTSSSSWRIQKFL